MTTEAIHVADLIITLGEASRDAIFALARASEQQQVLHWDLLTLADHPDDTIRDARWASSTGAR